MLYIGCSNYAAYRMENSCWISETQHLESFVTLQAQYSLVVRDLEREHAPLCRERGIGILPWSPLAGGFLTGKYRKGEQPPEGTRLAKWKERLEGFDKERNWRILDAVLAVSEQVGASPAAVSLAWLLDKTAVTSVIFGARTVAQVDDNVAAADVKLTDDHMAKLDEASELDLGYPYAFMKNVSGRW